MANDKTFENIFGGMPTGPDVTRLMKRWPELKPGDFVPYEEMEQELGVARESDDNGRFHTIRLAWQKQLQRDHGIIIRAVPGKGVKVLSPIETYALAYDGFRRGERIHRRNRKACGACAPENDDERAQQIHAMRLCKMQEQAGKDARKQLLAVPKVESLPQRVNGD